MRSEAKNSDTDEASGSGTSVGGDEVKGIKGEPQDILESAGDDSTDFSEMDVDEEQDTKPEASMLQTEADEKPIKMYVEDPNVKTDSDNVSAQDRTSDVRTVPAEQVAAAHSKVEGAIKEEIFRPQEREAKQEVAVNALKNGSNDLSPHVS